MQTTKASIDSIVGQTVAEPKSVKEMLKRFFAHVSPRRALTDALISHECRQIREDLFSSEPDIDLFTPLQGYLPIDFVVQVICLLDQASKSSATSLHVESQQRRDELLVLLEEIAVAMQNQSPCKPDLHPALSAVLDKAVRLYDTDTLQHDLPPIFGVLFKQHPRGSQVMSPAVPAAAAASSAHVETASVSGSLEHSLLQLGMQQELLALYRAHPLLLLQRDKETGQLPLHRAVISGTADDVLALLCQYKAATFSLDAKNRDGQTALQALVACDDARQRVEIMDLLLAAGADPAVHELSDAQKAWVGRGVAPADISPDGMSLSERARSVHGYTYASRLLSWVPSKRIPPTWEDLREAFAVGLDEVKAVIVESSSPPGHAPAWCLLKPDRTVHHEKIFDDFLVVTRSRGSLSESQKMQVLRLLLARLISFPFVSSQYALEGLLAAAANYELGVGHVFTAFALRLGAVFSGGEVHQESFAAWLLSEIDNEELALSSDSEKNCKDLLFESLMRFGTVQLHSQLMKKAIERNDDNVVGYMLKCGFGVGAIAGKPVFAHAMEAFKQCSLDSCQSALNVMECLLEHINRFGSSRVLFQPFANELLEDYHQKQQRDEMADDDLEEDLLALLVRVHRDDSASERTIDAVMPDGHTLLSRACLRGDRSACTCLLALNANPDLVLTLGGTEQTLLQHLASLGVDLDVGIVELLVEAGVDLGVDDEMLQSLTADYTTYVSSDSKEHGELRDRFEAAIVRAHAKTTGPEGRYAQYKRSRGGRGKTPTRARAKGCLQRELPVQSAADVDELAAAAAASASSFSDTRDRTASAEPSPGTESPPLVGPDGARITSPTDKQRRRMGNVAGRLARLRERVAVYNRAYLESRLVEQGAVNPKAKRGDAVATSQQPSNPVTLAPAPGSAFAAGVFAVSAAPAAASAASAMPPPSSCPPKRGRG